MSCPDIKQFPRKYVMVVALIACVVLVVGIGIGFASAPSGDHSGSCTFQKSLSGCTVSPYNLDSKDTFIRKVDMFTSDACVRSSQSCNQIGLPRTYVAYHLNDKVIQVDGHGDEAAWTEVPWTDNLVDIRADYFPKPRFETKAKIRWDDQMLYILAYIQETDLWANMTISDFGVWRDNSFETLMDVDGSFTNYKQLQVNVLGTTHDMVFTRSPYDTVVPDWTVYNRSWSSGGRVGVLTDGTVNVPGDIDKSWMVEMSFSFVALAEDSKRTSPTPADNEVWFMQFLRDEWNVTVVDNKYVKSGTVEDWWSWQPMGAINVHLLDRWGLVQFKRNMNDPNFLFTKWHVYKALIDVMSAAKSYQALNGKLPTDLRELDFPAYHWSRMCTEIPVLESIDVNGTQTFEVTVQSRLVAGPPGHIRSDRYVWFK